MKSKNKIITDSKSFVIDRTRWSRGVINRNSLNKLLNFDNTMCCIGFFCKSSGFSKSSLRGSTSPSDIYDVRISKKIKLKSKLVRYSSNGINGVNNTRACMNLIKINDDERMPEDKREELITKQFNKIGVKVKFIK